ncbi:transglycosylase domain-containing protein [Caldinitratiruptor microaerophilus]|uniref:Penicillin-binding protein 1A n=1 Tax=Caldinitratiruptor microaerophilus TaxID=671077 RepID=A0AA35CI13_9FIRM|nr:PBP1A family penicillin-binding protein [Caldinitratiruptor microaerophilus]BDG59297.1 hypothetical protein caldi_03870 [Caldinitratiruptor microaerophilus]
MDAGRSEIVRPAGPEVAPGQAAPGPAGSRVRRAVRGLLRSLKWTAALAALLVTANVAYALLTLPSFPPGGFAPGRASMVYDRDANPVGPLSGHVFRIPVRFGEIPRHLREAFVASEDVRFYQHPGVDLRGIARALWADLRAGGIREGGSTITQQVVKNALLSPRQTLRRKIQEAVLAIALERRYSKDEILTLYLNQIYLGGGAYGVGAAAQLYFRKPVSDLTLGEAATLAGLAPAPERYNPFRRPDLARERRNAVLDRMVAAGFLDPQQAEREKARPLRLRPGDPPERQDPHPWFTDVVRQELEARYGLDERVVGLMGLKVYTTLDRRTQQAAERALARPANFPRGAPEGLEAAVAAIDPRTGEVRALAGGRRYAVREGLNRATDARRQPGSAIKPVLVYAPAFELAGLTPDSEVDDSPLDIGGYRPQNPDGKFRGRVTVREAARLSLNVPAVRILQQVGVDRARRFAEGLGIPFDPSDRTLALALGGMARGVTPLELAAAYQAFANGGTYIGPHVIVRVEAADGVLPAREPVRRRAMSPRTAYWVTDVLRTAVRSGTGRAALLDRPMAGKTGTVELPATPEFEGVEGNSDAWFAGYTPDLVMAVWMGYDRTDRQHYLPPSVSGSTYPARIWRQIAANALAGRPPLEFPGPDGRIPPPPKPAPAPTPAPAPPEPAPVGPEPAPVPTPPLPAVVDLAAAPGPRPGTVALTWRVEAAAPAPAPGAPAAPDGPGAPGTGAPPPTPPDFAPAPAAVQYFVFRGDTPDVPADPDHLLQIVAAPPAVDAPPGPGTYYYRVAAVDPRTGQIGPPSAAVRVDVVAAPSDSGSAPATGPAQPPAEEAAPAPPEAGSGPGSPSGPTPGSPSGPTPGSPSGPTPGSPPGSGSGTSGTGAGPAPEAGGPGPGGESPPQVTPQGSAQAPPG